MCENETDIQSTKSQLVRKRGTVKGRLTLFEKYIERLDRDSLQDHERTELKLRRDTALPLLDNFNGIQDEIEVLVSESEVDLGIQLLERESFEQQYFRAITIADILLRSADVKSLPASPSSNNNSHISIKLPDIKLPSFDGSYDHWLEFKNSYSTMIHERTDLNAVQKFHYLKSSLHGNALQVISALGFTAENYIHAWELLLNRYDNHRLLVQNHVKSLFSLHAINKESASQIRKLIDTLLRNIRALKSLGEPTEFWDTLIIYMVVSKLDPSTEREWENHKNTLNSNNKPNYTPKLEDLLKFLRDRADVLDMLKPNTMKPVSDHKSINNNYHANKSFIDTKRPSTFHNNNTHSYVATQNHKVPTKPAPRFCASCGNNHPLYSCTKFLNLSLSDKIKFIDAKKLCHNCLRFGHAAASCYFGPCRHCNKKHNSLIHTNDSESMRTDNKQVRDAEPGGTVFYSSSNHTSSDCQPMLPTVLLSTALVEIDDNKGHFHTERVLLDSGSQQCFITDTLCKKLNIIKLQSTHRITGVGGAVTQSTESCEIRLKSRIGSYNTRIQCVVLPCITNYLPTLPVNALDIKVPTGVQLADPTYYRPSEVNMILGANIFWELLTDGKIKLTNGPYLQNSELGWIISGPLYGKNIRANNIVCHYSQTLDLLKNFWELEEAESGNNNMSEEEIACERAFIETTKRTDNGRFAVRIPLKESADVLGDSFNSAEKRFLALERKFARLPEFKNKYSEFMFEYENLGHMSPIDTYSAPHYFLPHHGVINENSSTTKLRTVFDASAMTSSGRSLNDIQMIGPSLQNDIFSILLRFRQYKYVACADVEKMYRQILIQDDQRNLQLILWRANSYEPIRIFKLNTVTYGTASAPFLSMRCLKQLAQECDDVTVARVINDDFYVDDLITGHDNADRLLATCSKVTEILQSACFPLRKWLFNTDISTHDTFKGLSLGENCNSKTLGLGWRNQMDELYFTTKLNFNNQPLSKRTMLSVIAQIYDPLGLLAPVIIIAKILMQQLWLCKLDWDDLVPNNVMATWDKFITSLNYLQELYIPRHVIGEHAQFIELHIFTDASQKAYGACAYIRTYSEGSSVKVALLCAKSRVAPLKPVSIPRLELCGALIGARLYKRIRASLLLQFHKVQFWTDSNIVLAWLKLAPRLLKQFVQSRVVEINDLSSDASWSHVNGKDNPADLLSRGVPLDNLRDNNVWWSGPSFLREYNTQYDSTHVDLDINNLPEIKSASNVMVSNTMESVVDFSRFSSFYRLKRTMAFVLRFINNSRTPRAQRSSGPLSVDELNLSEQLMVRIVQMQSFPIEYHALKNNLTLKTNSNILNLNVFMDKNNIIRVGGRLSNSLDFDSNKKHPVLLSSKHHFTLLLFHAYHKSNLHAGPQLLLATLRETWWPLGGRNLARRVVHDCIVCTRMKGKTLSPIMGNLPPERLEPGYPFQTCGVDYAGPVLVLNRRGRGARLEKAWICLFVCFTTKCVHLELVTSLSTEGYLLALKRFISRRGKPVSIFSDNGKNFVGAAKEFTSFLNNNSHDIIDKMSNASIKFKFIPPRSPHFGGLWESGVKSCKHHLRRVVGNAHLTYEEFSTILAQIEAILNSRPLSPLSSDPDDLLPLCPAHFLIGRPLTAPPCHDVTSATTNRLTRFQRLEQLRQHFWQRWSKEYIAELQTRQKWQRKGSDITPNSLVLIKEDNMPPLMWRVGRVAEVFPGADGVARVATITTSTGTVRRAFSKICPLPVSTDSLESRAFQGGPGC